MWSREHRRRQGPVAGATAVLLCAAALLAGCSPLTTPGAAIACDRVAAPDGSDAADGSAERPLRTAQALVDALGPGETGCLRAGLYADDEQVIVTTAGTRLASYPGERATLRARLWITRDAPLTTIEGLDLDGRNRRGLPSPTVNADDVVIRDNEITNYNTTICVSLGTRGTFGRARRTLIEGNDIHHCGTLPPTNTEHGIYVNSANDVVIRGNLIHDNADRGIQLYPDAQGTLISGNLIADNGVGVIFGGDRRTASSDNVVEGNLISGSTERHNVESNWEGPVGTGNLLRDNCVFDAVDGVESGGVQVPSRGFSSSGNGGPRAADGPCGDLFR